MSYNRSVKLKADDPLVHNALGVLFKDRKKYEEAVREFDKAFELNPGFLNARINKAQTFSLRGMNAEALAIYNEILREDPEVIPVLIFKAECLKELKRPEEARDLDWEGLLAEGDTLIVEWPERAGPWLPSPTHRFRLHHLPDPDRRGVEPL